MSNFLASKLSLALADNKKVFWLLTGGSTAGVAVEAAKLIANKNLANLTVSLTDERYGPIGHIDSNWTLLESLGLKLTGAYLNPVLTGQPFDKTTIAYTNFLRGAIRPECYKIALIGVGPDSHIAGIKPKSPAVYSNDLAVGYEWDDFSRITMGLQAIKKLDCAVSYLQKNTKEQALKNLQANLPVERFPSQALKQVKQAIIFNDLIGEKI